VNSITKKRVGLILKRRMKIDFFFGLSQDTFCMPYNGQIPREKEKKKKTIKNHKKP
jgi:hypothetical protein